MADSDDSSGSWPGLISQLNKTFDLIRDVFGYALPGAVFLSIGVIAKNGGHGGFSLLQLQQLMNNLPFDVPFWAILLASIAACYAAGSLLAAIIYMPISVLKWLIWMIERHRRCPGWIAQHKRLVDVTNITSKRLEKNWIYIYPFQTVRLAISEAIKFPAESVVITDPPEGSVLDWLMSNPTEVTAKTLEIRFKNRTLLNTLDRRETLNVMAGSLAAALIVGYYSFYRWNLNFSQLIHWGGFFALIQFATGLSHLRRVLKAVRFVKVPDPSSEPDLSSAVADLLQALTGFLKKQVGPGSKA